MNEHAILSTYAATLFALLNPLGMLPLFIGYTTGLAANVERWLALLVAVTVTVLMLIFLLTGSEILHFFGITLDAFRMAGGILLLLTGIQIVTGDPARPRITATTPKVSAAVASGLTSLLRKA
jgi:small neutral amino acid transporter SnatA (MarC family)